MVFVVSDLSTLASVVTTLATMGKWSDSNAINGSDSNDNASADGDAMSGGESNAAGDSKDKSVISKAFDTMAKVVQTQNLFIQDVVRLLLWPHGHLLLVIVVLRWFLFSFLSR